MVKGQNQGGNTNFNTFAVICNLINGQLSQQLLLSQQQSHSSENWP